MEQRIKQGEFYRHFKNKLYQIITVAEHSETGEQMVVYQALYGDYRTYVRPYDMFASEVDHKKYPEVIQKYRFERVTFEKSKKEDVVAEPQEDQKPHPALLDFLDAETIDEKILCLETLKKTATEKEILSLYVVLDMKPIEGDLTMQLEGIKRVLKMQNHYDGGRLR